MILCYINELNKNVLNEKAANNGILRRPGGPILCSEQASVISDAYLTNKNNDDKLMPIPTYLLKLINTF